MYYNISCTTTSADVVVESDTSAIWPLADSARGDMVGARGKLFGVRGGCGPYLHCSQGQLWLLEVFDARGGYGTFGPLYSFQFQTFGVQILKTLLSKY